jgi:putative ABC transport system permease protein
MNNKFSVKHYGDYPSFLKRFRTARPKAEVAAYVSWPPLLNEGLLTAEENCQLRDGGKLGYDVADEQVIRQLSFISKKELGYNKDQVLVVKAPLVRDSITFVRTGVLVNELGQLTDVNVVAKSSDIPGKQIGTRVDTRKADQDKEFTIATFAQEIDHQYLAGYGIELVAGRNFSITDSSRIFGAPNNKVLINETLATAYGYLDPEEAIGKMIKFKLGQPEHLAEVIGVVRNYHQRSLKEEFDPILYYYPTYGNWSFYSANITSNDWTNTISQIEETYLGLFPDNAFEYFFLNEFFDLQYKAEQRFGSVCKVVAGLAIFVTCLGIFGLSALLLVRRTKEIGVRRILGADLPGIVVLVSKDFIRMLLVANIIAIPIIVYFGKEWLDDFAYKVGLDWQIFTFPIVVLLLIILAIIGTQIYRSSVLNPIESLRSE